MMLLCTARNLSHFFPFPSEPAACMHPPTRKLTHSRTLLTAKRNFSRTGTIALLTNSTVCSCLAHQAISAHWFELFKTRGLARSHILEVPHPLVWIVQRARPVLIEAIARRCVEHW